MNQKERKKRVSILPGIIIAVIVLFVIFIDPVDETGVNRKTALKPQDTQNDYALQLERHLQKEASPIIIIYRTTSLDIEESNTVNVISTRDEVAFHKFDFSKQLISLYRVNGQNVSEYQYPFKSNAFDTKDLLGYLEVPIEGKDVNEIWFSMASDNIGYVQNSGISEVYYNLERIQ